jgi:IS6 family transposase
LFKRRRFPIEIIMLCVRWYCKYGISYRDLAEMMCERGVAVDPSTIFRWGQRYARKLRSGGDRTKDIIQAHGGSMRPMSALVDAGGTYFGRLINTVG